MTYNSTYAPTADLPAGYSVEVSPLSSDTGDAGPCHYLIRYRGKAYLRSHTPARSAWGAARAAADDLQRDMKANSTRP